MTQDAPPPTPSAPTPPPGRRRARPHPVDRDALIWEHPLPLLTNPFMLWDMARVLVAAVLLMQFMVLLVSFFLTDEVVWLPPEMMALTLAIVGGLFAFVALVIFRNAIDCRFTVDSHGARMETTYGDDAYEKGVGWVLRGLVFLVNPLMGLTTSLPGIASSSDGIRWSEITRVAVHRRLGVVALSEGWRTALRLYCDPRSVDMVAERVRAYAAPAIAAHDRRARRGTPRRSLAFYLTWTALALAAGVASLAWYWAADDMVRPAVAAVGLVLLAGWSLPAWWTRLLAWPALAASLLLAIKLLPPAVEGRPLLMGGTRYGYQSDTPMLLLAAAGCAVLLAMSAYLLRQRPAPESRTRPSEPTI